MGLSKVDSFHLTGTLCQRFTGDHITHLLLLAALAAA
jgi:hypothetical protein